MTPRIRVRRQARYVGHLAQRAFHHLCVLPSVAVHGLLLRESPGGDFWRFIGAASLANLGQFVFYLLYNLYLLDRGFEDTGEEQKAYTRRDRVIALGKKVVPEAWEMVGEAVGFFKCGAEAGPEFVRLLRKVIEEGDGLNEYEDALHMLLGTRHVGWVDVTGLPWTEIDFAEDLRRAEADVLPHVVRLDGA